MTSLLILVVDCWYYLTLLRSYPWLPVHALFLRCTYVIPNMAAYCATPESSSYRCPVIWWLMGHRSINSFITLFIPATLQLYWSTCIILASIGKKPCWAGSGCFLNKQSFSIFDRKAPQKLSKWSTSIFLAINRQSRDFIRIQPNLNSQYNGS